MKTTDFEVLFFDFKAEFRMGAAGGLVTKPLGRLLHVALGLVVEDELVANDGLMLDDTGSACCDTMTGETLFLLADWLMFIDLVLVFCDAGTLDDKAGKSAASLTLSCSSLCGGSVLIIPAASTDASRHNSSVTLATTLWISGTVLEELKLLFGILTATEDTAVSRSGGCESSGLAQFTLEDEEGLLLLPPLYTDSLTTSILLSLTDTDT
jgi:hypothetical protein